jgi:molybdopterin molybdotransferase
MISFEDAQTILQNAAGRMRLGREMLPVDRAIGRTLAEEVHAPRDIQPFDNSAMDGYAVHAADVEGASADAPVTLPLGGDEIAAGASGDQPPLPRGACRAVMTGAPIPPGADAVVPVENVREEGGSILFLRSATPGANIRKAGEDFRKGDSVAMAGSVFTHAHLMAMATVGVSHVSVYRRPKIAVLSTGRELVDDLSAPLPSGHIYNSNGPYAVHMLNTLGAAAFFAGTVADDPAAFRRGIEAALEADAEIILSTGGVSAGRHDVVRGVLEAMGAEILFHKVAMRPGKPLLFARLPGGPVLFGLPGNPLASVNGIRFFVDPFLRHITGRAPEKPWRARLTESYEKKPGFRLMLKARMGIDSNARAHVTILPGQQSFMISPLLRANVWVMGPEEASRLEAGDIVDCYPLLPGA